MLWFYPTPEDQENGVSFRPILSLKAGEAQYPSSKTVRQNSSLLGLFVIVRTSLDWMGPIHTGEGNLCYEVH